MQFEDTATYVNLARSFAGESQAGMRYQLAARMASSLFLPNPALSPVPAAQIIALTFISKPLTPRTVFRR